MAHGPAAGLQQTAAGDDSLRAQLAQVDERIRSVQAAKGSTRLLETERRGLKIRLAEPCLAEAAPPEAAAEHRRAADAQSAVAAANGVGLEPEVRIVGREA